MFFNSKTRFFVTLVAGSLAACSAQPPPEQDAIAPPRPLGSVVGPELAGRPVGADLIPPAKLAYELPGAFTRNTALSDLKSKYGDSNVVIEELEAGEDQSVRAAVVFPRDDTRRAEFFFRDSVNFTELHQVRVTNSKSLWRLSPGVGIGVSLKELEQINGRAFDFTGFDWDFGGKVLDWHGGKLQAATDSGYVFQVELEVNTEAGHHPYPVGDATFSSGDAAWAESYIAVDEIGVGFE